MAHAILSSFYFPAYLLHIEIPATSYVCLILQGTAVATGSWEYLWGYFVTTVTEATMHAKATEHPHGILKGTATIVGNPRFSKVGF